jgi:hypothetical protein
MGESCRYFDMPPSLPPPRKPHPLSPIITQEVAKGEYVEMKPGVARLPDVPPLELEDMGGEYAFIHK